MSERASDVGRDPGAFEVFYRATVHDVERFIARRVTDPHVVADLTAECYLVMIEKAATYRADRGSPRAWAFGIARHVVQDHHRRQARRLHAVTRISGRALLDAQSEDDLVARIDAERYARRLLRAVELLPPAEKVVFELVAVDGLTLDEAARVLGLRTGTARVRLHRARRRLVVSAQEVTPCPSR